MVVADNLATGLFQINVDKIVTVKYATYAAAKRKPEKNQVCRDSNPGLCDTVPVSYTHLTLPTNREV